MLIAFGQMNLHPWELDEYTMSDFVLRLEASKEMEVKEWERARLIAYYAVLPHLKKNIRIERFLPLPSDKKNNTPRPGKDFMKEVKEMMDRASKANWTKTDKDLNGKRK